MSRSDQADSRRDRITLFVLVTGVLLFIPLLGMFSDEVNWTISDFVIIAVLLIGAGLAYEFIVRPIRNHRHRWIFTVLLVATLLIIWAEFAVGVFGSPFAGS